MLLTFVTIKQKSISRFHFDVHADKSNKMSSDIQGLYAVPLFLSNGDFDSREKSGIPIIPATVQMPPMIFATFVFRALNCNGLQIA